MANPITRAGCRQNATPLTDAESRKILCNVPVYPYTIVCAVLCVFMKMARPLAANWISIFALIIEFGVAFQVIGGYNLSRAQLLTSMAISILWNILVCGYSWITEREGRSLFEAELRQQEQLTRSKASRKEVDAHLEVLLPPAVMTKLLASEDPIHSATNATVVVTRVSDFATWSCSMLPSFSVTLVDELCCRFDRFVRSCGQLTKLKGVGDIYIVAVGLSPPTVAAAGVGSADNTEKFGGPYVDEGTDLFEQYPAFLAIRFGLWQHRQADKVNRHYPTAHDFSLSSGVHTGLLVSGLLGEASLSFESMGEAYQSCVQLSAAAEAGQLLTTVAALQCSGNKFSTTRGPVVCIKESNDASIDLETFVVDPTVRVAHRLPSSNVGGSDGDPLNFSGNMSASFATSATSSPENVGSGDAFERERLSSISMAPKRNRYAVLQKRLAAYAETIAATDIQLKQGGCQNPDDDGHEKSTPAAVASGAAPMSMSTTCTVEDLQEALQRLQDKGSNLSFQDPNLEAAFHRYVAAQGKRHSFRMGLALACLSILLLLSVVWEAATTSVGIALVFTAQVIYILLALLAFLELYKSNVVDLLLLFFASQSLIFGLLFMETCVANASFAYLFLILGVLYLDMGQYSDWRWSLAVTIPLAVEVSVLDLMRKQMFVSRFGTFPVFVILIALSAQRTERRHRKIVLTNLLASRYSSAAETELNVHRAMLAMVVPPTVVDIVLEKTQGVRQAIVESLGDICVGVIRIDGRVQQATATVDFNPSEMMGLEGLNEFLQGIDAGLLCARGEQQLVNRVYVMGDLVMLAGPLLEHTRMKALPAYSTAGVSHFGVSKRVLLSQPVVAAATPSRGVVEGEEGGKGVKQKTTAHLEQDVLLSGTKALLRCIGYLLRELSGKIRFSAVLHSGAAFAAVLGVQQPTFSVLGPATRTAEALISAFPSGFCAMTSALHTVLAWQRDGHHVHGLEEAEGEELDIAEDPLRFKVRGVGVVAVRGVALKPQYL